MNFTLFEALSKDDKILRPAYVKGPPNPVRVFCTAKPLTSKSLPWDPPEDAEDSSATSFVLGGEGELSVHVY